MVDGDLEDSNLDRVGLQLARMSSNKVTVDGDWRTATGTDLELICILGIPYASTLRRLHVATVKQASLVVSREREFLFMFWSAKLLQYNTKPLKSVSERLTHDIGSVNVWSSFLFYSVAIT